MKINNIQQTTSFKSNVIVSFEEPLMHMEGLASIFVEMEGKIPQGSVGRGFLLNDGKSVLVPDTRTSLGGILTSAYYTAYNRLKTVFQDAGTRAKKALEDPQFIGIRAIIERDNSTEKVPYKEVL